MEESLFEMDDFCCLFDPGGDTCGSSKAHKQIENKQSRVINPSAVSHVPLKWISHLLTAGVKLPRVKTL